MLPKLINPSFGYSQQTYDVNFRMPMHWPMPQQPPPVHMLPNSYIVCDEFSTTRFMEKSTVTFE